jgi:8-oxo-dGTP pyrophosphatase MutT (NUDIX family)
VSTPRPDTRGDGDGWVECAQGHRHWGLYGAAGLLLHRHDGDTDEVLLQHRATWSHHGGTWGLLGGARQRDEGAVAAALREAGEEGGLDAERVTVHGRYDDAHGRWSYATVLGSAAPGTQARPTGGESLDVAWVHVEEVVALPLHPGFARSWPWLRRALRPLTVVVDAANVVGSRPDGWWRDRPGAARRLLDRCARLAEAGLADDELPAGLDRPPLSRWWPRWVVVVEGAARTVRDDAPSAVSVVAAPGSGDDAIVDAVAGTPAPALVVTADRELSRRCAGLGAAVAGPNWLLGL